MKKTFILSVALATLLSSFSASAQMPQRRMTPNDTLQSVRVLPDGSTVFSIYAPKARAVNLTGDMMPWGQPVVPVEKDGVWSFRVPNVKPGVDIEKEAERLHVRENAVIINRNCKEFVMTQGGRTDITYISGEKANKLFDEVGLNYEYQEVGEGHTWYTWKLNLYDEAQRLFKK